MNGFFQLDLRPEGTFLRIYAATDGGEPVNINELADYLQKRVFAAMASETILPDAEDVAGYDVFMEQYKKCLPIEHAAVDNFLL